MKNFKKLAAMVMTAASITMSAVSASASPQDINSYFSNNQQVIINQLQAQMVNIQQIAINIAVNVSPYVNVNLENIGPKF